MDDSPNKQKSWIIGLLLTVITLALYAPVAWHEFINYDDPDYVTQNPYITGGLTANGLVWAFGQLHGTATYWHPLTWLAHMLDCQLFGLNAGAHHLVNVVFHAVNALLLFLVLQRMTGAPWRSAMVAALFAWHPLQVDTVAWVAERKNVLSTLFWILTLWAYVRYAEKCEVRGCVTNDKWQVTSTKTGWKQILSPVTRHPSLYYSLALVCFTLGLTSKPMLVTLPFVLLLLDYWPLRRFRHSTISTQLSTLGRLVWEKLPFFALAAAASIITVAAHRGLGLSTEAFGLPLDVRIENALISYVRYLGKTIWPANLAVFYPQPREWPVSLAVAAGLALLIASGLAICAIRTRPYLFVGWFWFLGVLVPVLGLIQAGMQAMADRFVYVPLIGLFVCICWGGWDLVSRWPQRRILTLMTSVMALVACMIITRCQLRHWRNSQTLFEHCVRVTSDNFLAHNNLGFALATQGKLEEAKPRYLEALRIRPLFAEAHRNLGVLLTQQGKPEEAMPYLLEAVRIQPQFADVYGKLGLALAAEGRFDEAITNYREAIRLKPDLVEALNNLAWILATHPDENLRNATDAVAFATRACELTRREVPIMVGTLAAAYAEAGRFADACATAEQARALALARGQEELAQRNLKLLELYRSGQPWREPPISAEAAKPQP